MKIMDINELTNNFKVGDTVWGCTYSCSQNGGGLNRKPTKGILSSDRHKPGKAFSTDTINYFIPLKSDGKTPMLNKAVRAYMLKYASTEDECIEIYNDMIKSKIEWRKKDIARLRKELIKIKKKKE